MCTFSVSCIVQYVDCLYTCVWVHVWVYGQSPYGQSPYGFQRAWLKHNLKLKGRNCQAHREFAGKFESSNLSRDNLSREIGRTHAGILDGKACPETNISVQLWAPKSSCTISVEDEISMLMPIAKSRFLAPRAALRDHALTYRSLLDLHGHLKAIEGTLLWRTMYMRNLLGWLETFCRQLCYYLNM